MKTLFEYWWNNGDKVLAIYNFSTSWKLNGIKPKIKFRTNGAKKRNGDKCLDASVTIGYVVINYVNFNLQGKTKGGC